MIIFRLTEGQKSFLPGQSCTGACEAQGGFCNASATAPLSATEIEPVVTQLGGTCTNVVESSLPLAPYYDTRETSPTPKPLCYYSSMEFGDCESFSSHPDRLRLCSCGEPTTTTTTTTSTTTTSTTTTSSTTSTAFNGWTIGGQGAVNTESINRRMITFFSSFCKK